MNLSKTQFLSTQVEFLGYIVSHDGIRADKKKVEAITKMKPKNVKELKSFLGMTSYYRKFIRDYAKVAKPLTRGESARVKANQSKKVPVELDDTALQACKMGSKRFCLLQKCSPSQTSASHSI